MGSRIAPPTLNPQSLYLTYPHITYVRTRRARWWKQPSRRRPRPAWEQHGADEEGEEEEQQEEADDEGSEEGEVGLEELRACVLCRDGAAGATAVTRCARDGCARWMHCACALDRRCALRAPDGAADGFFCPGCETPVGPGSGIGRVRT